VIWLEGRALSLVIPRGLLVIPKGPLSFRAESRNLSLSSRPRALRTTNASHLGLGSIASEDSAFTGLFLADARDNQRFLDCARNDKGEHLIVEGLNGAIASKRVTYDFARLMEGATAIKCSKFGDNIISNR